MKHYDKIIVFDLETTGLDFKKDRIIEFGAIVLEKDENGKFIESNVINEIVNPGMEISEKITEITGITNEEIREKGIQEVELYYMIKDLFISDEKILLIAYNVQFDISFMSELLLGYDDDKRLITHDLLDVMAVFKDNHEYPHRLVNAIEVLELSGEVVNSHRACDDARATWAVFKKLFIKLYGTDYPIEDYVNVIGYHKKIRT